MIQSVPEVTAAIDLYTRVELTSSRHERDGARKGMIGYVIASYRGDMYEVEFSERGTGTTTAVVVAHASELVRRPETAE